MKRKHLGQFVAAFGLVLILYVLSFAPLATHDLMADENPNLGRWIDERRVYQPVWWLIVNGEGFNRIHAPYFNFWLDFMRQRKFEELKAGIEAKRRENPGKLPPDLLGMLTRLELEKLEFEFNRKDP